LKTGGNTPTERVLATIFVHFVQKFFDSTVSSFYWNDAGCWYLASGLESLKSQRLGDILDLKRWLSSIYPASSIQDLVTDGTIFNFSYFFSIGSPPWADLD
jgi:hypothetical protein